MFFLSRAFLRDISNRNKIYVPNDNFSKKKKKWKSKKFPQIFILTWPLTNTEDGRSKYFFFLYISEIFRSILLQKENFHQYVPDQTLLRETPSKMSLSSIVFRL